MAEGKFPKNIHLGPRISVLIESHQKATELGTKVILKDISKSVLKVIMMAKLEQILNLG